MGDVVAQPESLPFRHGSLLGSEGLNEGTGGSQPEVLMQVAPVGSNCSVGGHTHYICYPRVTHRPGH